MHTTFSGIARACLWAALCLPFAAVVLDARAADTAARLETPASGPPRERVRRLWDATRPIVLADAKAGLSDAEFLKRRLRVFDPWIGLQVNMAADRLKGPAADAANKLVVEVLGVIDKVYGIPFYAEKKRIDIRNRALKKIDERLAAIDRKVADLP